ncbi:MAG: M23 family metallopeptidase [Rhodothermales bacterium]
MWKQAVIALVSLFLFGSVNPDPYPDDYFESPLGIPLLLSGSFAEMRSNHFHGGLDIKTQGHAGFPVYAAAEGWISRIAVTPGGYGNALYVSHPNGYMTVYAHLDRFEEPVASFINDLQYKQESFAVQSFPERDQFKVRKGQQIAWSGNSGSSAGPHLHFEVRDERTAEPVNPALWGFDIPDTTPPRIYRFKVYAKGSNSMIRLRDKVSGGWQTVRPGENAFVELIRANGSIEMQRVDRIEATGPIAFGVQTHDFHEGSNNLLGHYRIDLTMNGNTLFRSVLERFSFGQTRFLNAHVDYAERRASGRWVQRGHVLPGNELPLYEASNRGIVSIEQGQIYSFDYRVEDVFGNAARFEFEVHGMSPLTNAAPEMHPANYWQHDEPFTWRGSDYTLRAPAGAIYDDVVIEPSSSAAPSSARRIYSNRIHIHTPDVPVHRPYRLSVMAPSLPVELRDKATLGMVGSRGTLSWAGGAWEGNGVTSSIRTFGDFVVTVDTEAPSIRPLNISAGKNMSRTGEIRFRIRDDFSGIASYRGTINGKWVLFEYDSKYALLRHRFDGRLGGGSHEVTLSVLDNKGNEASVTIPFTR